MDLDLIFGQRGRWKCEEDRIQNHDGLSKRLRLVILGNETGFLENAFRHEKISAKTISISSAECNDNVPDAVLGDG